MTKIAFIGLGAMGGRMARRLAETDGIDLSVFDLVPERLRALEGSARLATSVADAADGADGIFSVVPADRHVRAVVDEVVQVGRPGQAFVEFSTIGPATMEQVGEQLMRCGVESIAAGMTKSIEGATNGTLSLFIGGPDALPERLTPAFDALAKDLMFVGSPGAAKALKLVNNMVVSALDIAITEALALGKQYGFEFESVTDALIEHKADSWALRNHIIPHVLPDDLGPGFFSTRFLIKDLGLYIEFASQHHLPAWFAGLASADLRGSAAHGFGDDYHMIVVRWFERGAQVGERETSQLPPSIDRAEALRRLAAGVASAGALVSTEAVNILGRMDVAPADAAFYLESGSAGNDSLRALSGVGGDARPVTLAETLDDLGDVLELATAAEVPGAVFEMARHVTLASMDRHGRDAELWQTVAQAVAGGR